MARGAKWLPEGNLELKVLLTLGDGALSSQTPIAAINEGQGSSVPGHAPRLGSAEVCVSGEAAQKFSREQAPERKSGEPSYAASVDTIETVSFYTLFLNRLRALTARTPATVEDLLADMDIVKSQLQEWLKRAINDGHIKRLGKPVRYEWRRHEPVQGSMFDTN